jgi:hypothetical protein
MSFINKKEEVIQIELTQYGRRLLSKGKFKPIYYSFYDDEILYDGKCAGIAEHQNDIETRIKDNIRQANQPLMKGVESSFLLANRGTNNELQKEEEKALLAKSQLAHMELGQQNSPAFTLTTSEDVIVDGLNDIDGKGKTIPDSAKGVTYVEYSNSTKIPQVNIELKYKIFENRDKDFIRVPFESETFIDLLAEKIKFLDGTGIRLEKDNLIFELIEDNCPYEISNFEVQLFEISPRGTGAVAAEDVLIPIDKKNKISKLFNISVDREVPKASIRNRVRRGKGFFVKE